MNPEQAAFVAQMFAQGLEREYAITRRILAAVPEDNKHYRPDENSRTAFALASHIATSDVWFLNGIAKGEFVREGTKEFGSVAEIVAYYDKEFPAALAKVKALPGRKAGNRGYVRDFQYACGCLSGICQQSFDSPSRAACGLFAADGSENPGHLRRKF